jgi:hypothetical protein
MLTREEAKQLVLARLKDQPEARGLAIAEDRTIERPFGWLFVLGGLRSSTPRGSEPTLHGPLIVNKYAEQVIASSIDYPPERFVELYETLLVKSRARRVAWCLSLSLPVPWSGWRKRRLAKHVRDMGFYELRQKSEEPS